MTCKATGNPDGSYTFTVPSGVSRVLLAAKGDVSGDGGIDISDVAKLYAQVKQDGPVTGEDLFVAEINGDHSIDIGDVSALYSHVRQQTLLTWDT